MWIFSSLIGVCVFWRNRLSEYLVNVLSWEVHHSLIIPLFFIKTYLTLSYPKYIIGIYVCHFFALFLYPFNEMVCGAMDTEVMVLISPWIEPQALTLPHRKWRYLSNLLLFPWPSPRSCISRDTASSQDCMYSINGEELATDCVSSSSQNLVYPIPDTGKPFPIAYLGLSKEDLRIAMSGRESLFPLPKQQLKLLIINGF